MMVDRLLLLRQFLAEFLGTFVLVLMGCGSIAQAITGKPDSFFHHYFFICFGWGFALMIAIIISGGVSGGHVNPAVTFAMAIFRKCSWIQVPVYWLAQYVGAFFAASLVFLIYHESIDSKGGKNNATAPIFATYPNGELQPSTLTGAFDEVVGSALLILIIASVTDKRNMKISEELVPLYIGFGLSAILMSFGMNSNCALNPARDFSPRLFSLIAGWSAKDTFQAGSNFFWIPLFLPHLGATIGALLYYGLVGILFPKEEINRRNTNKQIS